MSKTTAMLVRVRLVQVLLAIAAVNTAISVHAQSTQRPFHFGISAGMAFQPDTHDDYQKRLGQVVSGQLVWRVSPRFGVSSQLLAARFGADAANVRLTYAPNSGTPRVIDDSPFAKLHSLASVSANLLLFDDDAARTGRGAHFLVGMALFRPIHAADHVYVTRLGWRSGLGYDVHIHGMAAALDVGVQQVARWSEKNWLMFPLTLGFAW